MRLFVLGATGGNGRAFIAQALERGHAITAFVRSPEKLGVLRERVTIRQGDPRNEAEVRAAMKGHDAVVSSLGPPGLGRTTIIRDGARCTVTAMQASRIDRLLIVSSAALFPNVGMLPKILSRTLLRDVVQDCAEMERIVTASQLDWTIVRPPRLTNGSLTRHYNVEDGRLPSGKVMVSRSDVAHFLLTELEQHAHSRRIAGIAGGRS